MKDIAPSYHNNPSQRTPCLLVLDASGSMGAKGEHGKRRIDDLNEGLEALARALKEDSTARYRVQIAIVCVGGPAGDVDLLVDWTDASDFRPPVLTCGGQTPLGAAMDLGLRIIEEHKADLRANSVGYTRPWIILMSDGEPTDLGAWQDVCYASRKAETARKCVIYPLAVTGANVAKLQAVSATPVVALPQAHFSDYFRWLSSSLASLSKSRPGQDVQLPAIDPWAHIGPPGGTWAAVGA